jgi:hypothetical protein
MRDTDVPEADLTEFARAVADELADLDGREANLANAEQAKTFAEAAVELLQEGDAEAADAALTISEALVGIEVPDGAE